MGRLATILPRTDTACQAESFNAKYAKGRHVRGGIVAKTQIPFGNDKQTTALCSSFSLGWDGLSFGLALFAGELGVELRADEDGDRGEVEPEEQCDSRAE